MRFVDTDVLLYAVSRDPQELDKARRANEILAGRDLALSVGVLQEFYVQATRGADGLSHDQAVRLIESFMRFPVQATTTAVALAALATCERHQISYWDATVVEASRSVGCDVILSEALGGGRDFGGVRVEDPFRAADAV